MSETSKNPVDAGYGYSEHVAGEASIVFGLNAGNVRLTKFQHTMTGGKAGADLEAMDIVFTVKGKEKGYRQFPVIKAYAKTEGGGQEEVTDPSHPAITAKKQELSATMIHIVGCFVDSKTIQEALSANPIQSFKHYCSILQELLPSNFSEKPLDAFGVWQWQIGGEAKNTYLEFPKNMKHGRWLSPAIEPIGDKGWQKQQKPNASLSEVALRYVDADGRVHPFNRNGWFMESNFAQQQKEAPSAAGQAMQDSGGSSSSDW